ncbi:MAG: response regulator [Chitinispirillia bacterium]|nr:response regulator [Chitinispirillia bacterium]
MNDVVNSVLDKAKHSILIVDDQESGIVVLKKILGAEYTVYTAMNGQEAIDIALECLPDVILLDILMLDMTGYEVISVLKSTKTTKDTPIIFLTSLMCKEEEEKGLALGAADYITKPFSPAVVKMRIKNQINMLEQLSTIKRQMTNIQLLEYENVKNMLDSSPLSCQLWNKNFELLDCNEANLQLFKPESKNCFLAAFHRFSPEYQPDGTLSSEKASAYFNEAIEKGKAVYEYMHIDADGTPVPCEITLVRIELQSDCFIAAYVKDLREQKAMIEEILHQEEITSK